MVLGFTQAANSGAFNMLCSYLWHFEVRFSKIDIHRSLTKQQSCQKNTHFEALLYTVFFHYLISFVITVLLLVLTQDSSFHSKHRPALCSANDTLLSSVPAPTCSVVSSPTYCKCHSLNWSILLDQMHWSRTTGFPLHTDRQTVTSIRQTGADAHNVFDPWS